ncbi:hypothetical protein ECE50_012435 [Chitinophaga sp. Mgbs1]|uniref:Uncharacterized protein n=1 Tax=Chitinophaga solisilvae TaxID=1233460 RepID=A0A3S1AYF5_9BACT|nr:hypothetical protein [Chitinophaga solisilvae]
MSTIKFSHAWVMVPVMAVTLFSCRKNDATTGSEQQNASPWDAKAEVYHPRQSGNTIEAYYRGNLVQLLEIENGKYLLGGDIVLKKTDIRMPGSPLTESTINGGTWSNKTIYYRFDPSASDTLTTVMWPAAIQMWTSAGLGLQFVEDVSETQQEYILLQQNSEGSAYATSIGAPGGEMVISIDPTAFASGNVAHEIGHALGLEHEQTRHDRDLFVNVNTSGLSANWAYQYNIKSAATPVGSFDFSSIMLYPSQANRLTKTDGTGWPYNRRNLSATDILGIRYKYNITTYTSNGTYELLAGLNGTKVLTTDSLISVLRADTSSNSARQRWRVSHQSNGYYKITAWSDSTKSLTRSDTNVALRTYTGTSNQQWAIVPAYLSNSFRLVSRSSNKACAGLDTAGLKIRNFARDSSQQWSLRKL